MIKYLVMTHSCSEPVFAVCDTRQEADILAAAYRASWDCRGVAVFIFEVHEVACLKPNE